MAKNEKIVDLELDKDTELPEVPEVPDIPDKVEKKKKAKKPNVFVRFGRTVKAGYTAVKESPAAALIGAGLTAAAAGVAYGVKLIISAKRDKGLEDDGIADPEPVEIEDSGEEYIDEEPTDESSEMDEAV